MTGNLSAPIACMHHHRQNARNTRRSGVMALLMTCSLGLGFGLGAGLGVGTWPTSAAAQTAVGIVAVVNEDIISSVDLEQRVRLAIATTGLPNNDEVATRLRPQILRSLVDEKLQLQDAERNGIRITQEEINEAIATIEKQRGRPPGSLEAFLSSQNISTLALYSQLRAQIAWSKLVIKKLRPRIKVGEQELQAARQRQANAKAAEELQIAVIALPINNPSEEANIRQLAEKLVGEIRGGADFQAVAQQLSQSGGGAAAGEAFWIRPDDLDPTVSAPLKQLSAGNISAPIRTPAGYQIVKLLGKRQGAAPATNAANSAPAMQTEVLLKQILLSLKPDAKQEEANVLLDIARAVAANPGSCADPGVAGLQNSREVDITVNMLRRTLEILPEDLRNVVARLKVGKVSDPFATERGLQLVMLCEKIEMPATDTLPAADPIRLQLMQEKLGLEVEKYLRSLRRDAFVEVKL